jgi:hypothetical protein
LPFLCWGSLFRTVTGYPSGYTDAQADNTDGVNTGPGIASARKFSTAATEDPSVFTTSAGGSWQAAVTIAISSI